jgi:hypothetical protein
MRKPVDGCGISLSLLGPRLGMAARVIRRNRRSPEVEAPTVDLAGDSYL